MRLLVTADLHDNHAVSQPRAIALIDQMSRAGGDVLLPVGDTGVPNSLAPMAAAKWWASAGMPFFVSVAVFVAIIDCREKTHEI